MKTLFCQYFKWQILDEVQLFWEGEDPQALQLMDSFGTSGVLTLSSGKFSRKDFVEYQVEQFVARHGGYLAPMDEEFPDELTMVVEDKLRRINQHFFLRYGPGYALNLTIRGDLQEQDFDRFRRLFSNIEIHEDQIPVIDSPALELPIDLQSTVMTVGQRNYLESQLIHG